MGLAPNKSSHYDSSAIEIGAYILGGNARFPYTEFLKVVFEHEANLKDCVVDYKQISGWKVGSKSYVVDRNLYVDVP